MIKNNVVKLAGRDAITDPLRELLETGAEQLIYQAVEAELLSEHSERGTADDIADVVRNRYLPECELQTVIGPVAVRIPKVLAKTGEPLTFRSVRVRRMCGRRDHWKRRYRGCT